LRLFKKRDNGLANKDHENKKLVEGDINENGNENIK
jgi:hypothetical protein